MLLEEQVKSYKWKNKDFGEGTGRASSSRLLTAGRQSKAREEETMK